MKYFRYSGRFGWAYLPHNNIFLIGNENSLITSVIRPQAYFFFIIGPVWSGCFKTDFIFPYFLLELIQKLSFEWNCISGRHLFQHSNEIKNCIVTIALQTYIIGHYKPSVRIIDLVSHTTHVVYVNFMREWRDLQFNVDSERQIFSWQFYLLSEFLPEIAAEKLFVFCFDVWPGLEPWLFV